MLTMRTTSEEERLQRLLSVPLEAGHLILTAKKNGISILQPTYRPDSPAPAPVGKATLS